MNDGSDGAFFCPVTILAHEIGHNFGNEHEGNTTGVFPYARGHFQTGLFHTIMAVPSEPIVTRWSDPNLTCPGDFSCGVPVGQPGEADAARAMSQIAPIIAGFRTSPPDLVVLNVDTQSTTLLTDQEFQVAATVKNSGGTTSPGTVLRYYRSADSSISTADSEIGSDSVPSLSSGLMSSQTADVSIDSAGIFWIGACVGAVIGELEINNNCSPGIEITVVLDTDRDGTADEFDLDDDNDGLPDDIELANGLDPLSLHDASSDKDGDGLTNLEEHQLGTDISD